MRFDGEPSKRMCSDAEHRLIVIMLETEFVRMFERASANAIKLKGGSRSYPTLSFASRQSGLPLRG